MKNHLTVLVLFFVVILTVSATSGIELYNQGRLYEAKETLEQAVETGRAGPLEMAVLGMTYTRLGMYAHAERILGDARQLAPEDPQVLNALAMLEFATGDYEHAYHWLDRAQSGRESSAQSTQALVASLINRAVRLYQQSDLEQAAAALEEARQLDPQNARVIAMLIQLHKQQGNHRRLIELYRAFVEIEPENAQAYAELGILLDEAGQPAAAEAAFLQAELYSTEEPYPYFYLARRAAEAQTSSAELRTRLHLAIGKAVRKIASIRVQAAGSFQQQQGDLTAEDLEALQELTSHTERPKRILQESIELLKQTYEHLPEYEQDLERLIEWYPHSLELRCALGGLLEEQGRYEDALEHWRELLSDFKTTAEAHMGLARSLQTLGRDQAAQVAYRRARDIAPENPQVYRALQELYTTGGREQELLQLYTEIYERERTNSTLIYAWAELEEQLGLTEQATVHRLRAAELEQRQEQESGPQ
ncbi:MAG: tetratricopeptide repeat protein [Spirochaetota bacterium]